MTEPTGTPPQEPPSQPPSEPPAQAPTETSPPAAEPPKKKTSPWLWVGIGCLAVLILIGGSCAVVSFFVAKKVKDVAEDFEANPAKVAAEMAIKLNPDLELVESDDDDGTITVRNTTTGEEASFDYGAISEGRFSFKTDEGEVSFDVDQVGQGGMVTVTTDEGETRFGAGSAAEEAPDWVPVYPDATSSEAGFTSRTGDEVSGLWSLETDDSVEAVKRFYESKLDGAGYRVTVQTFSGPTGATAIVSGESDDPKRQINASVTREGDTTQVAIQYSGKK